MWRKCLTILLHVDIVFSQHYLLKSIYMHSPWNNLGTLFENHLIIHVRVYFWALYSVPLVLMPVPYFLLWCCSKFFWTQDMRPPGLFFICRIVLAIWGPLSFHMIFRMSFSISAKTAIGVLVAIALNLQIALGSVVMLTVLIAPWTQSMNTACPSIHLYLFIVFSSVTQLSVYKSFTSWFNLFLSILFFLMLL